MVALSELLAAAWRQVLVEGVDAAVLDGKSCPVGRTRSARLRTVAFQCAGRRIEGIEQNPEKASRWAELARAGEPVMQFSCEHRYFAVIASGKLTRYPAWKALGLPE